MGRRVFLAVALLAGAFYTIFGAWALLFPRSFFEVVAVFPPYNEHFLHDLGAFQLGLGTALFAALAISRSLVAVLVGVAVGSVLHAAAHAVDADLGGQPTDPWALGLFAALVVLALIGAWRSEEEAPRR